MRRFVSCLFERRLYNVPINFRLVVWNIYFTEHVYRSVKPG